MEHGEFRHPRLVEVYDAECPWGPDDDLFRSLVGETPHARVVDLGCGTGRLTVALAAAGHAVTGVDPAGSSLDRARTKDGAEAVSWVHGTSADLPTAAFDVAVMTSHVAQFFVGDDEWAIVLDDLARAVVPGGRLVFDSRDPDDRAWERWNPTDSARTVVLSDGLRVDVITEVTGVEGQVVAFTHTYRFADGEVLASEARLRFRPLAELRTTLAAAGFAVEQVFGGWRRQPVGRGDGEHVVVARRGQPARTSARNVRLSS
jgi:SAM-dependent methyltransferase